MRNLKVYLIDVIKTKVGKTPEITNTIQRQNKFNFETVYVASIETIAATMLSIHAEL